MVIPKTGFARGLGKEILLLRDRGCYSLVFISLSRAIGLEIGGFWDHFG